MISAGKSNEHEVKNLLIRFDINCHRRELPSEGVLKKFKRNKNTNIQVWDNFDIFEVSSALAKSLKAGGFTHIVLFFIDKIQIYSRTGDEAGKRIKEAIKLFEGESELRKRYKRFRYKVVKLDQKEDLSCEVDIRRMHDESSPAVTLKFKGRLSAERYNTILRNINRNLKIKDFSTTPHFEH